MLQHQTGGEVVLPVLKCTQNVRPNHAETVPYAEAITGRHDDRFSRGCQLDNREATAAATGVREVLVVGASPTSGVHAPQWVRRVEDELQKRSPHWRLYGPKPLGVLKWQCRSGGEQQVRAMACTWVLPRAERLQSPG